MSAEWVPLDFSDERGLDIYIWDTKEEYQARAGKTAKTARAFFHPDPYTWDLDSMRPTPNQMHVGEIHFVKGDYGAGAVVHEVAHACFQWAELAGLDLVEHEEQEQFCTELGEMVRKFWEWHYGQE